MTVPLIERFPRPEQAGNLLQTSLSVAISTTVRPVAVTPTSTVGWPTSPGFRFVVNGELMLVTYVANNGLTWLAETVEGTVAATHLVGAVVTQVLTAGALTQFIADHRAASSPTLDPHPMYVRKESLWTVRTFGAAGDGVTDDTDAIQSAINAAGTAGGGTVLLGPGTFLVRGLVLRNKVWIRGAGMAATMIRLKDGANSAVIRNYVSADAIEANAEFCGVLDLGIDGNRFMQSNTAAHAIAFDANPVFSKATNDYNNDMHHLVQNVWITEVHGDGVNLASRGEDRIINVHAYGCDGHGFVLNADCFMLECTAGGCGLAGYYTNAGQSLRMVGCKAFYSGTGRATPAAGFHLFFAAQASLVNCEAQDNTGAGFFLDGSWWISLTGCHADSNSTSGIGVYAGFEFNATGYVIMQGAISWERKADGVNSWQRNALKITGGDTQDDISIMHSAQNGAVVGTAVMATSSIANSTIRVNGVDQQVQSPAFVSPYTPDPYLGTTIVMTLTAAITINNPSGVFFPGQQMTFLLIQDGTGGRVVTWGAAYKVNWTPTTTASKRNSITFTFDGTNWNQIATGIGM